MARIKRKKRDGSLLVGYRPHPNTPERYGVCPTLEDFETFNLMEEQHHRAGKEVPNPNDVFGRPERDKPTAHSTLRAWIGTPSKSQPGLYFTHCRDMDRSRWVNYEQHLGNWVFDAIGGLDMRRVRRAQIVDMVNEWLKCPACEARAAAAGLELKALDLAVTVPAFDGACVAVDEEGDLVSTHYPAIKRRTMENVLSMVSAAFNVGKGCDEPVCEANPVAGYQLPRFEDRPSNEDQTQALNHLQLQMLSAAHPAELAAVPLVMAYGLLRRSELFGMNRADIRWPGPGHNGVAQLKITRVFVWNLVAGAYVLRPWGKTKGSTEHPVELARPATETLRRHMDLYRSTPNPAACKACAEGVGEWASKERNPHRRCDFADDAPVFVNAAGERFVPSTYTGSVFPEAVAAAGLTARLLGFRVTPKTLRATGGTLLLELGVADEVVMRMGRWSNIATLKRHYTKLRDASKHAAAVLFGQAAAAELGLDADDDAPIDVRLLAAQRRAELAEAELVRLRALVEDLGGDPAPITAGAVRALAERVQRGVWTEDRVRHAVEGAQTQKEILERLGVALAGKHYRKLAAAARQFDLTLPGRWEKAA